ncbi:MAG: ATP-dependent zinc metalloprotease FtsH [Solirubrobacterales bacterium]
MPRALQEGAAAEVGSNRGSGSSRPALSLTFTPRGAAVALSFVLLGWLAWGLRQGEPLGREVLPPLFALTAAGAAALAVFIDRRFRGGRREAAAQDSERVAGKLLSAPPKVRFGDVCGLPEAKQELQDIVDFLRTPERYLRLGARMPAGILLIGPPGTGKTLMARAIAGEAGVPFFACSGSEFVEVYAGMGASRVRDLFNRAARHAPAIVFIDEIDSVGRSRGSGVGNSHDEREQTLNEILARLDGFERPQGVFVIAATNRPEILDPALLRPGRFDRKVRIGLPETGARTEILEFYLRGKPLDGAVTAAGLARQMPGFSGADLEHLVNEASILAARRHLDAIGTREFEDSIERVMIGSSRGARVLAAGEKEVVAYHEAGHVLAMVHEVRIPVQKVTILGRGESLGYTMSHREQEIVLFSEDEYRAELVALLAGRAAERLKFNRLTTSGASDLSRATDMANAMVSHYGMSAEFGPLALGGAARHGANGAAELRSEHLAARLTTEVRRLLEEAEARASQILSRHSETLDRLAAALIEKETLDRGEIEAIVGSAASVH